MSLDQVSLAEVTLVTAIILAGLAGAKGLLDAILDFRAKALARDVLARKVMADPELQQLSKLTERPSEQIIERAAGAISKALENELSARDRRRVEEGLHQPNKMSEWRYISMLF